MIATIHDGAIGDFSRYEIEVYFSLWEEKDTAEQIRWLDIPSQPKLKGEWTIHLSSHNPKGF